MHVVKDIRRSLRHKQYDEFFKLVGHVETKDMKLEVIMLVLNPEITTVEVTQKVHDIFLQKDKDDKGSYCSFGSIIVNGNTNLSIVIIDFILEFTINFFVPISWLPI